MNIVVGADHAGFELKEKIKEWLLRQGYAVSDVGTSSTESVDYPDYAKYACELISNRKADLGILFCGTGVGISIAANKINGILAACVWNTEVAKLAKEHSNANVITMGGRILDFATSVEIVKVFLETHYAGGRHNVRLNKIVELEKNNCKCR